MKTSQQISRDARTLLIICGALCVGPLIFAAIILIASMPNPTFGLKSISMMSIPTAVMLVVASFPISNRVWASFCQQAHLHLGGDKKTQLEQVRVFATSAVQKLMIVRFAILEGAAFLNLLAALIENNLLPWCAGVFVVGLMIVMVPTPARFESLTDSTIKEIARPQ